jgi:hypothetical protein
VKGREDGSSSHVSSLFQLSWLLDFLGHSLCCILPFLFNLSWGGFFSSHLTKYQLPTLFHFTEQNPSDWVCLFVCLKPQKKREMMFFFSLGASSTSSKFFSRIRMCQELAFDNKHHIWQSTILCWNIYLFIYLFHEIEFWQQSQLG